jgi:hypothetical protein
VYVRERVSEGGREGGREKALGNVLHYVPLNVRTAIIVTATLLVACTTSDRKKEFCRER